MRRTYLFLLTALPGLSAEPQITVNELLDRWQAGVDLIRSYDLAIELRSYGYLTMDGGKARLLRPGEKYPPVVYHSRIKRLGSKRRGEFGTDGVSGKRGSHIIVNGDSRIFNWAANDNHLVAIQNYLVSFGSNEYEDYEATYRAILGTIDRIALSRARRSVLGPREGSFYVVETPAATEGDWAASKWMVWLDPKANYLPVRIRQWFVKSRTMLDRELENELSEVAPGVWAPIRSTMRVFSKDEKSPTFGKCIGLNEITVNMDNSTFNLDLDDTIFEEKIPVGATVVDRIRNITYTEGSTDPDTYLAHIAASGKKSVRLLSAKEEEIVEIPDDRRSPYIWLGLIILALAGCGGIVIGFRRRTTNTNTSVL